MFHARMVRRPGSWQSQARSLFRLVTAALAIALAWSPVEAGAQEITGAGASFPAPLYTAWGQAAGSAIGVRLNYQGLTSGTGVSQVAGRTVDFGASDAPVPPQRLQAANLLQFPTVIGAVVVVVNIPGIKPNQLKLTGEIIGDIYLGKISEWNDPRIVALNPDLKLLALPIVPLFRAGSSGTNFVFTSYLAAVSPAWKRHPGVGPSVHWDAGFGTRGSSNESLSVRTSRRQHRLCRERLRNSAPSGHRAASQQGRPVRRAGPCRVRGGRGTRGLEECTGLRGQPDRPGWRADMAHGRGHLRLAAARSKGCGEQRECHQVL